MIPVAVKTCKVESEESMGEKFLEEACKTYFSEIMLQFLHSDNLDYVVNCIII